jgi:Fe2+ transport system protein FeoA
MLMRLSAMGIREGDVLLVVSRLPMGPVIVEHAVHGHRVIVGHGMASRIEVVPE